jgi:AAA domain-containing protein
MFSPQALPKPDPRNHVVDVRPGEPMPWEHPARPDPGKTWRHEVFGGVYELSKVRDVLVTHFGQDDPETLVRGQSALFGCTVDADGLLIEESAVLSACAWAIGQVSRGQTILTGFEQDALQDLSRLTAITSPDLHDFTRDLTCHLGVADALQPQHVRVKSYQVNVTRADGPADHPSFLNSFIAEDLARVADELSDGNAGSALMAYLSDRPHPNRVDVREQPLAVRAGCAPDRLPPGRWATATSRPLAFSQQFAVNEIMRQPAGLFAVNGPPGTGKTTMLRDVIAAVIVGRAIELSRLTSTGDAFPGPAYQWQPGPFPHTVTALSPALTGFEMVVASSNNGAVENVTAEIPGRKSIDERWREDAAAVDYFSETAGDGAWALIAAKLGNRANCSAFTRQFWWNGPATMRDILGEPAPAPSDWPRSVAAFRRALAKVEAMTAERAVVSGSIERLRPAFQVRAQSRATGEVAAAQHADLRSQLPAAQAQLLDANVRWQAASDTAVTHRRGKPSLLALLSARGRARRRAWAAEHAELRGVLRNLAGRRDIALGAVQELADHMEAAQHDQVQTAEAVARLDHEIAGLQRTITDARQRWGAHVPDGPEYADAVTATGIEQREKSAPWADEEFAAARTALFLAALALHKAFIRAQAPVIRRNLSALMDIMSGKGTPDDAATLAAWQTFFVVVPVVSTTFASLGRLFTGLGRESLGWLFVDEAGQAAPQYAAGALWRARRAVIVGDPLQIQPVVTLPWGGQRALASEYGVGERWTPSRTSVQQLADRLAEHGTSLPFPAAGEPVWVGTPLRVHRRCDRPMFDISNAIAYDGLMVFGTRARDPFPGRDRWCDVASADAESHWIPAEGQALSALLAELRDASVPAAGIRVISPFRKVAAQAYRVHESVFPDVSTKNRAQWIGTVHTMQGKEADVVILVLGGDPAKPGARHFATRAPNLLNVAVTRARRRLYIIGNRETWAAAPYFDHLSATIP